MRCVRGAGRVVQQPGLVGCQRVLHPHPGDRLIRQVPIEDVVRVAEIRLDRRRVLIQRRMPLIAVAAEETVEVLKAEAVGHRSNGPAWLDIQSGTLCILPNQEVL